MFRVNALMSSLLCMILLGGFQAWAQAGTSSGQSASAGVSYTGPTSIPGLAGYRVKEELNSSGEVLGLVVDHHQQQVQTLNVCTQAPVPRTGDVGGIAFADYNFDGYPDLSLLVSSTNQNHHYCVWLFNPQTKRFALSQQLSHLTNPAPDLNKKEVVAFKHEGCNGECWRRETYHWSGNQLLPNKYVAQNEDPVLPLTVDCRFVRTVKQEEGGRLEEVSRERVNDAGFSCTPHPVSR
jgi:hypothetical protein